MLLRIAHISDLHIFDSDTFEKYEYDSIDFPFPIIKPIPGPFIGGSDWKSRPVNINIPASVLALKHSRKWQEWLQTEEGKAWEQKFREFDTALKPSLYALGGVHPDCLDDLLKDISSRKIDHVIITGDITNTSNEWEYQMFLAKFGELIVHDKVSVVPGNHDTPYLDNSASFLDMLHHLIPQTYPSVLSESKKETYPYIKELNSDVCLIGLNSTKEGASLNIMERLITNSRGELSDVQLAELRKLSTYSKLKSRLLIVALHHHILDISEELQKKIQPAPFFMEKLLNAPIFLEILQQLNVRLVLTGHLHYEIENKHMYPFQIFTSPAVFHGNKINYKVFNIDTEKNNIQVETFSISSHLRKVQETKLKYIIRKVCELLNPWARSFPRR